jgi:hypothetical protein
MKFNEERRLSKEWEASLVGGKTEVKKRRGVSLHLLESCLEGLMLYSGARVSFFSLT